MALEKLSTLVRNSMLWFLKIAISAIVIFSNLLAIYVLNDQRMKSPVDPNSPHFDTLFSQRRSPRLLTENSKLWWCLTLFPDCSPESLLKKNMSMWSLWSKSCPSFMALRRRIENNALDLVSSPTLIRLIILFFSKFSNCGSQKFIWNLISIPDTEASCYWHRTLPVRKKIAPSPTRIQRKIQGFLHDRPHEFYKADVWLSRPLDGDQ